MLSTTSYFPPPTYKNNLLLTSQKSTHTSEVSLVVLVQILHHNGMPLCFEALTNPMINNWFPPLFAFPEFHTLSSWGFAML
jgi:hypothetical protein